MFHQHKFKTPIFAYSSLWQIFNRVEIQSFYTTGQRNHGSIWINCSIDNNQLFTSISHLLCCRLSIAGGSDSTSVRKVSRHLIQVGFSSDNMIPPSLNNFKRRCTAGRNKVHIPDAQNSEAMFKVLN